MVKSRTVILIAASACMLAGCHTDMWLMPRARIQGESDFFPDQMDSRGKVPGTVAQGKNLVDEDYQLGRKGRVLTAKVPASQAEKALGLENYKELLALGKDRFTAFCSPCHGQLGNGEGMIAHRGFKVARPVASYHTDRLRKLPDGHIFDVMTNGYGAMFAMGVKIPVAERWAIVAYVRALQRSQAPEAFGGSQ